jgi:hypothetical protein
MTSASAAEVSQKMPLRRVLRPELRGGIFMRIV